MILILDDHPIARQGLCTIIQMNKPEEEIVQAGTVREAIRMLERSSVGMAFIDVNLGKEDVYKRQAQAIPSLACSLNLEAGTPH